MTWSATSRAKAISWVTMIMVVFCWARDRMTFSTSPGELGIQGRSGLVKTEDVGVQGQGPGDGHPLLLAARQLVRIVVGPVGQPHPAQQLPGLGLDLGVNLFLPRLVVGLLLGQKLLGQHHVLQGGVLGEQVEGLEHQPEVEPLAAHLRPPAGWRDRQRQTGVSPFTRICPRSGVSRKFRHRSRVVLPLPEDPMMARAWPFFQVGN